MNADLRRWRRSYRYLAFGAGESEIADGSTSDLRAAHRLMAPCKTKPPGFQVALEMKQIQSLLSQGTFFSYVDELILNEGLRYARVCRELARRVEPDAPESALALLRSALLPESSVLALGNHEAYTSWWDSVSQQVKLSGTELEKLTGELEKLTGGGERILTLPGGG